MVRPEKVAKPASTSRMSASDQVTVMRGCCARCCCGARAMATAFTADGSTTRGGGADAMAMTESTAEVATSDVAADSSATVPVEISVVTSLARSALAAAIDSASMLPVECQSANDASPLSVMRISPSLRLTV